MNNGRFKRKSRQKTEYRPIEPSSYTEDQSTATKLIAPSDYVHIYHHDPVTKMQSTLINVMKMLGKRDGKDVIQQKTITTYAPATTTTTTAYTGNTSSRGNSTKRTSKVSRSSHRKSKNSKKAITIPPTLKISNAPPESGGEEEFTEDEDDSLESSQSLPRFVQKRVQRYLNSLKLSSGYTHRCEGQYCPCACRLRDSGRRTRLYSSNSGNRHSSKTFRTAQQQSKSKKSRNSKNSIKSKSKKSRNSKKS